MNSASQDPQDLAALAQSLADIALQRGLHVQAREAEAALREAAGDSALQRLRQAWQWLCPGWSLQAQPLAQAHPAQLPAWIEDGAALGIAESHDAERARLQIRWLGLQGAEPPSVAAQLWVPQQDEAPAVADAAEKPATAAIRAAMRHHMPVFRRAALASLIINCLAVVASLFSMQVYDRVVPNFAYSTLWVLTSGVVIAYVFDVILKMLRLAILEHVTRNMDEALSTYFFEKILALKVDRRPSRVGTLVAQIRDYESVKSIFTSTTLFTIADVPFTLLFVIVIGTIGGLVALVPLTFAAISVAIGWFSIGPIARAQRQQTDDNAARQGFLFEAINGAETIKTTGSEWRFTGLWQSATRRSGERAALIRRMTSYVQFAAGYCQQLAYIAMLVVGVYQIERGIMTMGGLIACSILGGRVLGTIAQTSSLLTQGYHARYSLSVLDTLLSLPTDDRDDRLIYTRAAPLDYVLGNLKYGYDPNSCQLQVAALNIKAGERIAVLGRNGSGKSSGIL